jgi:hypothetical protein
MPPFVHLGPAGYLPGAGNLGAAYNPRLVADPSGKQVELQPEPVRQPRRFLNREGSWNRSLDVEPFAG